MHSSFSPQVPTTMSEKMECFVCQKPTTSRCGNCKFVLICSRECLKKVWKTHKPDCQALQRARTAMESAGLETPTPNNGSGMPLTMPAEEYAVLFAPSNAVRDRHSSTEERLLRKDPTLQTRAKIQYYLEMLQALDATSDSNNNRTLVQKMALNRKYNNLYRDAVDRLTGDELNKLNHEMKVNRVGEFFKQNP